VNDGIAGRAKKVLKLVEELGLEGWDWIRHVAERMKELMSNDEEQSYLDELVGGRPLLSSSKTFGGFRIRFDATNAPLTHFTPRQINTAENRLVELLALLL